MKLLQSRIVTSLLIAAMPMAAQEIAPETYSASSAYGSNRPHRSLGR